MTNGTVMLSTVDNPYDPFTDFTSWFLFDIEKGYNSCGKLARIANYSDDMTQKESDEETERAVDEIIKNDTAVAVEILFKQVDIVGYLREIKVKHLVVIAQWSGVAAYP